MIHKVYEPSIRVRLGTAAHFCEVVVLKLRTVHTSPLYTHFNNYTRLPWYKIGGRSPSLVQIEGRSDGGAEKELFIDNLLVRIHFIIVMIRWTGLAPWEFEFPFPDSLTFTFLGRCT